MPRKKSRKLLFTIILIILISAFLIQRFNSNIYQPVDAENNEDISFSIKKGETIKEIAENLENNELINSSTAFYIYVRYIKADTEVIAGRFLLKQSMNVPDIIKVITDPSQAEYIITIQEGLMIRDIDQKLVELGLINSGDFINEARSFSGWEYYDFLDPEIQGELEIPVEGYLYPDTYYLDPVEFEPHDLIYLCLDNFENKINNLDTSGSPINDKYNLHEVVTMASIIENEVFGNEDRKIVSGILWKRLENNWTLGADATLLYITEDRKISAEDLEMDSPYNTRKNQGLPPGPISNPSMESISAAYFPTESDFWFYLTTLDTGEVIYAKTNEEHNQNRNKYL